MSNIIDRRLNPKDRTIRNRQKFIQRGRDSIKEAVKRSIDDGNIADIEGSKARVRVKGMTEPHFHNDSKKGDKRYVMPGNDDHVVGDRHDKPKEQGGGGGTQGGPGEGEDDFEFVLNKDEYLDFIFEDLELPDMIKKQVRDVKKTSPKRSGYTNTGNPSNLDVIRSLKNGMGRRIGLKRPKDDEIEKLKALIETTDSPEDRAKLEAELAELLSRKSAIPWLDPVDVRYRNFVQQPVPTTQAVMICLMDVSGSMGKREKDMAKRFFFLLHMFLHRKYERVDIVFVRHHESAKEVDEEEFFHGQESGGTIVSTGLKLSREIIEERYPQADWNVYIAQASDGDNWSNDQQETLAELDKLMPLVQYFAYVEIGRNYQVHFLSTELWATYEPLCSTYSHLAMRVIMTKEDIWKVFRGLFSEETA